MSSSVTLEALAHGEPPAPGKPRLRGVSHLGAFFVALLVGPLLVLSASGATATASTTVYALTLVALFGCSALLHRGDWSPQVHPRLRRLDHSTIFLFIAGTYTPVVALGLESGQVPILVAAWVGAGLGIAISLLWIEAPRWITTACYLAVGWLAVAALPQLNGALGTGGFGLLAAGGLLFSVGAVVYARKRPDPFPTVFGYHEVYHAFVIVAVALHFALVASLAR